MVTSTDSLTPLSDPLAYAAPVFRISPEKFAAMVRDGNITEDDPVEYLEGMLVEKMTKSNRHVSITWHLRRAIDRLLSSVYFTLSQDPIDLTDSQPEPDIVVVRGRPEDLETMKPLGSAVPLVIEVSDTTLRRDRELKRRIYAKAMIPEYWLVNLNDNVVHVYSEPAGGDYQKCEQLNAESQLEVFLDGQRLGTLHLNELLHFKA